jgi:glycosyltransferase involved in cell wall biosynthesis
MQEQGHLITVVIPTYNEAARIDATIGAVVGYLESVENRYRWELIVVDDGSTDDTLTIAEKRAEADPRVRVAAHPANFKLGQALRYGFSLAKGDYLVVLDADLSYDPDHIGRLVEVLDTTRAKVVIASPYMDGGRTSGVPRMRLAASRMANRLLASAAKGNLTTITGMVRGYDVVFLRRLDLKAMDAEINAEIIYKAQLMRASIVEIPAHLTWTRTEDAPRRFRPGRSISAFAFVSFLFRPYAFFLVPSASVLVIAMGLFAFAAMSGRDDPSVGVLIAASTAAIVAAILGGMAVLSAQMKRYFEELFHLGTASRTEKPPV